MSATVNENAELAAFLDEVLLFHRCHGRTLLPLVPLQITELEQAVGRRLPMCLRAVLTTVGLLTNPFGMLDRRRDWAGAEPWLVHAAVGAAPPWEVPAENLVAFADSSGSSDYQLLACDDHLGRRVFAFEHAEGLLTPTDLTLLDFLKGAWNTAKPKLEKLTPRHWSVQFSVSVRSEQQADLVLARIAAVGDATIATAPVWTAQFLEMPEDVRWPTTPVSYYERRLQLAGEQVSVRKVPGHAEAGSKLVFTLSDPETELDSGRVVSVRRLLSDLDVTFVECDYGLL